MRRGIRALDPTAAVGAPADNSVVANERAQIDDMPGRAAPVRATPFEFGVSRDERCDGRRVRIKNGGFEQMTRMERMHEQEPLEVRNENLDLAHPQSSSLRFAVMRFAVARASDRSASCN